MKRYPHGIEGDFFFMKRAPSPRPDWISICSIEHESGNIIDFPVVRDLASLLWIINLGCIDLNQWYARCDDTNRPDYLHFDLDPTEKAGFAKVLETDQEGTMTLELKPPFPGTGLLCTLTSGVGTLAGASSREFSGQQSEAAEPHRHPAEGCLLQEAADGGPLSTGAFSSHLRRG